MSIINQMLKDLKQRSSPVNTETTLSGLLPSSGSEGVIDKKQYGLVIGIFIFTLALILIAYMHSFSRSYHQPVVSSETPIVSHVIAPAQVISSSQPKALDNEMAEDELQIIPTVLTGIALQTQENITYLRLLLNQDVFYKLSTEPQKHQLIITFEKTSLVTDLPPLNYLQTALKNITMTNDKNGNLQMVLTLLDTAEIKRLNMGTTEKSTELQIDLLNRTPQPVSSPIVPIPTPSLPSETMKSPTREFNAEQQYVSALSFSSAGENEKAMPILFDLVAKYPDFTSARETLVSLLLEEGNREKAKLLLRTGLQQQPYFPAFIKLEARILVEENKVASALSLLLKAAPPISQNPDYHAFIAALYQRQGKFQLAGNLYEQLLLLQPANATWWVGLGISLEGVGKNNQANDAYLRAASNDGLTPELKVFVQDRLHNG